MFFSKSPSLKSRRRVYQSPNHQIQKSKSAEEIPKVRGFLKSQRIPQFLWHMTVTVTFLKLSHHGNWGGRAREEASKKSKVFCTRHASLTIFFDGIFLLVSEEIHKILLCCVEQLLYSQHLLTKYCKKCRKPTGVGFWKKWHPLPLPCRIFGRPVIVRLLNQTNIAVKGMGRSSSKPSDWKGLPESAPPQGIQWEFANDCAHRCLPVSKR